MKCKITYKSITPFMSFGKMPIANGFIEKKNFLDEFFFNMEVGFNEELSLFQLNDHPKPEKMFNKNYPFFTGSSEYMKRHFKEFANFTKKYLSSNSKIIEIGSNDGTLLKNFNFSENKIIGIEPSKSVADVAIKNKVPTINEFFNTKSVKNLKEFIGTTDLICASNVICHIPDLNNLIESVDLLLSKNGTFIFEEPYLGSMFEKTSYDQIYDEHIFMFSLHSIKKIFNLFDFELIDAIPQITHGGSIRYVVGRKNIHKINKRVHDGLGSEKRKKMDDIAACLKFKKNCENSKRKITGSLKKFKENGKRICGYAATAKSSTILNYCNINSDIIDFICDTTKEKVGKFSPGAHIPVVSLAHFHKNLPDIAYLFAWNHKNEVFSKEKEFLKNGGKWYSHVSL